MRRGRAVCFLLAIAGAVQACGGSGSSTAADGAAPSDAKGGGGFDGAIPAPGEATLSGPQAFPVGSAHVVASLTAGCGGSNDAGLPVLVNILISSQGLPSLLCVDSGIPDGGPGDWIDIAIATTQAAQGVPITMALMPGDYVVGNEGQNDPDPCMLPAQSNAYLQVLTPGGTNAQALAISGTVTIDSIGPSAVTGTFSVLMGDPYGRTDASPPPSLSGAFNATTCP